MACQRKMHQAARERWARKPLPRSYDEAVARSGEFYGFVLWPPIWESVEEIEHLVPRLAAPIDWWARD